MEYHTGEIHMSTSYARSQAQGRELKAMEQGVPILRVVSDELRCERMTCNKPHNKAVAQIKYAGKHKRVAYYCCMQCRLSG